MLQVLLSFLEYSRREGKKSYKCVLKKKKRRRKKKKVIVYSPLFAIFFLFYRMLNAAFPGFYFLIHILFLNHITRLRMFIQI